MAVEIGARVLVLGGEPPVCRDPLKEGEIVKVVATKPAKRGGLGLTVCRDDETARHFVHSSSVVILGESRPIAEMSAAEMVERYFDFYRLRRYDFPEYKALLRDWFAVFELLPKTPSKTEEDFNAKLRFAIDRGWGFCEYLPDLLSTLSADYVQMRDRIAEEERVLEEAENYDGDSNLKDELMPAHAAAV